MTSSTLPIHGRGQRHPNVATSPDEAVPPPSNNSQQPKCYHTPLPDMFYVDVGPPWLRPEGQGSQENGSLGFFFVFMRGGGAFLRRSLISIQIVIIKWEDDFITEIDCRVYMLWLSMNQATSWSGSSRFKVPVGTELSVRQWRGSN